MPGEEQFWVSIERNFLGEGTVIFVSEMIFSVVCNHLLRTKQKSYQPQKYARNFRFWRGTVISNAGGGNNLARNWKFWIFLGVGDQPWMTL